MEYAKIENGIVTSYPYTSSLLRKDAAHISFPKKIDLSDFVGNISSFSTDGEEVIETILFSIEVVKETAKPTGDIVTEEAPSFSDGVWKQTWGVRPFTEEERSERITESIRIAKHRINRDFEQDVQTLVERYPDKERESWPQQEQEAKELLANQTYDATMLSGIASARGIPIEELAERVIVNSTAWRDLYGKALGAKQARMDALLALDDGDPDILAKIESI